MLLLSFVVVCQCCCIMKSVVSVVVGVNACCASVWFVVCYSVLLLSAYACC